jgi:GTP cyclohydrolase I
MSYDKNKTCDKTGMDVNEYLRSIGLQTPLTEKVFVSDDEKIQKIISLMTQVMETLGLDLSDDSLNETPKRVAKMYVKELMYGLRPDNFPKCTTVENKFKFNEEFVLVKGMETHSLCEHHLVYFGGKSNSELGNGISIAYCPKEGGKVLGLSKLYVLSITLLVVLKFKNVSLNKLHMLFLSLREQMMLLYMLRLHTSV